MKLLSSRPVAVALCLLLLLIQAQGYDYLWQTGRATNYGSPGDPWSIMTGSCGYGYLDPNVGTGWDVAALADTAPDYGGSCGRCYEIACNPAHVRDGYGQDLDRTSVCYDSGQSVVIMVTDSCPCNYPPNYYSNKRWCCGDSYHFDVSRWAFEKLADPKWGVISVKFRAVPCDHCPWKPASLPSGRSPSQQPQSAPWDWNSSKDKRPSVSVCKDGQPSSSSASACSSAGGNSACASASSSTSAGAPGSSASASSISSGSAGSGSDSSTSSINGFRMSDLFSGALSGWRDQSYKLDPWNQDNSKNSNGNPMFCGTVQGYGASVFSTGPGMLNKKKSLELVMKAFDGKAPAMQVTLQSPKGDCRMLDLEQLQPSWNGDAVTYTIQLASFSWFKAWQSWPVDFTGCSSNIGAWDVNQISIKNKWGSSQQVCLKSVKFY